MRTINDVKEANARMGHHFFAPDTMRFFKSRVSSKVHFVSENIAVFVTSERFDSRSARLFTVTICNSGAVERASDFQAYGSARAAHRAAEFAAKFLQAMESVK